MIRDLLADILAGLIFLAVVGFLVSVMDPNLVLVLGVASIVGFIVRAPFDRWRQRVADDRGRRLMNRNRARYGMAPIGRASAPRLSFPDRPIIPRKDARFEMPVGASPLPRNDDA